MVGSNYSTFIFDKVILFPGIKKVKWFKKQKKYQDSPQ